MTASSAARVTCWRPQASGQAYLTGKQRALTDGDAAVWACLLSRTRAPPSMLKSLVARAAEAKADAVLITALDETAWLFNMRGGDVDYNPIFVSYGLVTAKEATLFVDAAKVRA